jgi:intracellular septation protein A
MAAEAVEAVEVPTGSSLLKAVAPRLMLDILAPPLAFYGAWKPTDNLLFGVIAGTAASLLIYAYERHKGRPGLIAQVVLVFVLAAAIVGVVTDSTTAYLIQPAALGAINGLIWLGSVALGKPLAAAFAREVFPVPEEIQATDDYRTVFRRVSLYFGIFFVVAAAVQLAVLLALGVGAFVAVRVLDALAILAMIAWSVRHITDKLGHLADLLTPQVAATKD